MKIVTLAVSALIASALNMYFRGRMAGVDLSPSAFARDWDWGLFFQFVLYSSILGGLFSSLLLLRVIERRRIRNCSQKPPYTAFKVGRG